MGRKYVRWNDEMDDAVKTLYENDYDDREIADYLQIDSEDIVTRRRRLLGLCKKRPGASWPEADVEKLKANLHLTNVDLAKLIGRTTHAVITKKRDLGLRKNCPSRWAPQEIKLLWDEYPSKGSRFVAAKIGRTVRQVQGKAQTEGIRRER